MADANVEVAGAAHQTSGFSSAAAFANGGSAALLRSSDVVICSAGGSVVLSASFPEAIWLEPEDSCLMAAPVWPIATVQQITLLTLYLRVF